MSDLISDRSWRVVCSAWMGGGFDGDKPFPQIMVIVERVYGDGYTFT